MGFAHGSLSLEHILVERDQKQFTIRLCDFKNVQFFLGSDQEKQALIDKDLNDFGKILYTIMKQT